MTIYSIRHDWPEKADFLISRPNGHSQYTFLHFATPVTIKIGNNIIDARPGACIFYAPKEPQWFYSSDNLIHNWMHMGHEISPQLDLYGIPQNCLLYPASPSFISEVFRKIELEYFSDHPHKQALIDCYMQEFLINFSRALSADVATPAVSRNDRLKFRRIRQEVLSQSEKKWTVSLMAELAALSPSRFHTLYKAVFGTSPIQDVIAARISYAKSMLLSSESLTLPEIADKLGYNDQFHFIRQFKAVSGLTPGEYRKKNR